MSPPPIPKNGAPASKTGFSMLSLSSSLLDSSDKYCNSPTPTTTPNDVSRGSRGTGTSAEDLRVGLGIGRYTQVEHAHGTLCIRRTPVGVDVAVNDAVSTFRHVLELLAVVYVALDAAYALSVVSIYDGGVVVYSIRFGIGDHRRGFASEEGRVRGGRADCQGDRDRDGGVASDRASQGGERCDGDGCDGCDRPRRGSYGVCYRGRGGGMRHCGRRW